MNLDEITAVELSKGIKKHEISVKEALDYVFENIEKKEAEIGAYIEIYKEEAYAEAEKVQKRIDDGQLTGPLAGIPVAVKDNICTAGHVTSCASEILSEFTPPYDAHVIRLIRDAGMILVGRTNMDEFAMGSTTETSSKKLTRNPWNTDHVPGGSSGGSCAAVAAGEAFIALGSDTGGSIRQPSSFCGVTGIKPTYGTVSRYGLIAYASSLDQIGPIGRSVEDCAALLQIISAYDEKDATCVRDAERKYVTDEIDVKGLRIGIPEEYISEGLSDDVKKELLNTADRLRSCGAEVSLFSMKTTEYVIPAYYIIAAAEASSNLERFDGVKYGFRARGTEGLHDMYRKTRTQGFGTEVKRRIMLGSFVLSSGYYDAYYLKALKARRLIKEDYDQAFQKYDLILAPAAPYTAPHIGESLGDPLAMYLGDIYTVGVNLCGLPGLCLPTGAGENGLPVGMQLIGREYSENVVFAAAEALEKVLPKFHTV